MQVVHLPHRFGYQLRRSLGFAGMLLTAMAASPVHAHDTSDSASQGTNPSQLAVQVNDDRMTLSVAKVPQVYLYGTIDAGAAQRVQALVQSNKIPQNSDIYLNSPGGDMAAGMALGRLFRAGKMTTHLGSPRRTARQPIVPKTSQCVDACAYAYAGGLFRWAPTGSDRFGAQAVAGNASATDATAYLKEMGVDPKVFGNLPKGEVTWLNSEQMRQDGMSNNGRLTPTAVYGPANGGTSLTLTQLARDGEHRLVLQCRADGLSITANYAIGADRARQMVARATHSYFEINDKPAAEDNHANISTVGSSVVFTQTIPLTQLNQLPTAYLMAAWLADRGGNVRYGFWMEMDPVRNELRNFSNGCQQIAKQAVASKS
ncbi:hypothetical protein [Dyella telluris]|uniref:Uncharacterized protein n=1 Tax=Dyella telluris TaxID=2763498 RepID=A0A7G8PZ21_9GAMM|nr:hypothetical protein [Dyella telluris]QNJ99778.1 hypothetical protein H8F01_11510 [Dyella telluris]